MFWIMRFLHTRTRRKDNMLKDPRKLTLSVRDAPTTWVLSLCCLLLLSCSMAPNIPVIDDDPIDRFVRDEASRIVAVTEDANHFDLYQILLSDFPRRDILGLSIGNRRIYISYALAKLAANNRGYVWLLRQTLAHEIAHEMLGHAQQNKQVTLNSSVPAQTMTGSDIGLPWTVRYRNYAPEIELQADLEGMKYWAKLNWNCRIWVNILKGFDRQHYAGDQSHPTDERLKQASETCPAASHEESVPLHDSLGPAA
jgi:predicted Zn-dependent protease